MPANLNRRGVTSGEYLEAIGVSEYDPLAIVRKTAGRMAWV